MKKFYAIGFGIVFVALMSNVNGQSFRNEFTGVSSDGNLLKSSSIYDVIRLRIENKNEGFFDGTVIYFYDTFSDDYGNEDSNKMFNNDYEKVPEIFTRIGNAAMAINGFSALDGRSYISIPISVRNRTTDKCEILAQLDDFTDEYNVVLEDKEIGQYTNLHTSAYSYTPSVLGIDDSRFVLHLSRSSRVATSIFEDAEYEDPIRVLGNYGELQVTIDGQLLAGPEPLARIDVFDMSGKKIISRSAGTGLNQIELAGNQIYIVSVIVGNQRTTKKVAVR